MNISYFRKTEQNIAETAEKIKKIARDKGITVVGEITLPSSKGVIINICRADWAEKILSREQLLLGVMPCSVLVIEKDGKVMVGIANPELLAGIFHIHELEGLFTEINKELRDLINTAAGVGELKPVGVRLYSTATCPYCKMEKAYLDEKGIKFELIMVDSDQKAAEEMVQKTGQMGVPVTGIKYEDGEEEFIVGFDKNKLNQILGIK